MKNNTKTSLVSQLLAEYKKTLNPASKWFADDLKSFQVAAAKMSAQEINEKLARLRYMNGGAMTKAVAKEVNKMQAGGMFEVKKMSAKNALS